MEMAGCWSKGINFGYKMNKFWGSNIKYDDHELIILGHLLESYFESRS